jgi:hypothetical protein
MRSLFGFLHPPQIAARLRAHYSRNRRRGEGRSRDRWHVTAAARRWYRQLASHQLRHYYSGSTPEGFALLEAGGLRKVLTESPMSVIRCRTPAQLYRGIGLFTEIGWPERSRARHCSRISRAEVATLLRAAKAMIDPARLSLRQWRMKVL